MMIPAALVILAAGAGLERRSTPPPAGTPALRYRVADNFYSWAVHQGTELTVVRTTGGPDDGGGKIVMVAGPKVGDFPAVMVRNVPVLAQALGGPATLGPGHVSRSGYGGTAVLDSFRFALRPGNDPATIDGRMTTHRVLTVESWWVDQRTRTPVRETGRADLWFAGDLPFSLVPLTLPLGTVGGALPLSQNHPEVSAHVLGQVIGELEPLGLLLRARVIDSVVPDENPDAEIELGGGAAERSIEVDSIQSVAEEPGAPEWTGLPVLTAPQGLALEIGMIAGGEPCSGERATGSFEYSSSGPVSFMAGGAGASLRDGEGLGYASVVLGGRGRNVVECTLVILSDSASASGTYTVIAPSLAAFAGPQKEAIVVHFLADPAAQALTRFLALEAGEVRLERADGHTATGTITGTGWVAELDPRFRRRVEDGLGFEASFEAPREAGGRN
jgi:hypothetical protein